MFSSQATIRSFCVIFIPCRYNPVEDKLIKRAAEQDHRAIAALYDAHAPALLAVCIRYCGNREDAEDILHDGFIKIIRSLPGFRVRADGSLGAWMRRIIVNTALNFLRQKARSKNLVDIDPMADRLGDGEAAETDDTHPWPDVGKEKLMEMICTLPAGYRAVFNLYVFEDYGHREIAALLGCTENTSKSQLFKARALLRKKLNEMVKVNAIATYEKT